MHKLCAYMDEQMNVHFYPKTPLEAMGLKYLGKELATHGLSLIHIETDPKLYEEIMEKEKMEK